MDDWLDSRLHQLNPLINEMLTNFINTSTKISPIDIDGLTTCILNKVRDVLVQD